MIIRSIVGSLTAILLFGCGVALIDAGRYGWTVFIAFPFVVGGLAVWVFRPPTQARAAIMGALSATLSAFLLLVLGLEGLICVLMCVPLTVPFGALGGWIAHRARTSMPGAQVALLLLIPSATFTWDSKAQPKVYAIETEVTVAATPEQVWKNVIAFPALAEPEEWFFRTGLAYPQRARLEGSGAGAIRYCEFSTGAFVEPIVLWDEPRVLRFRVTENPSPLHEWSPYGDIHPKHLHGYMVSKQGEFRLFRLSNGSTLLRGTTWYQHGLWPAEYWRWWSDAIIHRIHLRVLNHVRVLAEQDQSEMAARQ